MLQTEGANKSQRRTDVGGTGAESGADTDGDDVGVESNATSEERVTEPSRQEIFDILSNQRRRYALYALTGTEKGASLGALAEQVAAWENDTSVDDISTAERKRVYTALQQSHLPKMERAGVVTFQKDEGRVEPMESLGEVDIYLDVVNSNDIPWNQYYLGLSLLSTGLLAAVSAGLPPFSALPTESWFAFAVCAFVVSAGVHTYYAERLEEREGPPGRRH